MPMPSLRRVLAGLPLGVAALALALGAAAPSASADPMFPVTATVDASTHIAKTGMNVTVPPGSFNGAVDLANGAFNGTLSLPPADVTIKLLGEVPLADATFAISPGPISGHIDFATLSVTTSSTFRIRITKVSPHGTDANLVGSGCTTSKPVTVTMSGVFSLTAPSTFSGAYTIPTFEHCGALTIGLNQLIPGPGNTFSATFVPQGGALPTTTTTTTPSPLASSPGVQAQGPLNGGGQQSAMPLDHSVQVPLPPVPAPPPPPGSPSSGSGSGGLLGLLFGG
jgi:hypothetical protein